jgi:hypothetical protein
MTSVDLGTTNLLLGIMAAVSVLEMLALIGAGIMAYRLYANAMTAVREIEARQIAPLAAQVNTILTDVKSLTDRVNHQTERVDEALHRTINRVDETAERVKSNVRGKAEALASVVRELRGLIEHWLGGRQQPASAGTNRVGG